MAADGKALSGQVKLYHPALEKQSDVETAGEIGQQKNR